MVAEDLSLAMFPSPGIIILIVQPALPPLTSKDTHIFQHRWSLCNTSMFSLMTLLDSTKRKKNAPESEKYYCEPSIPLLVPTIAMTMST